MQHPPKVAPFYCADVIKILLAYWL